MRTLNKTKINSAILLVVSLAVNNSAHALSSVAIDCGWVPGMTSTSYVLPCGYTTEYLDEMESATATGNAGEVATLSAKPGEIVNAAVASAAGSAAYEASKVTGVVHGTPEATAAVSNYKAPEVLADAQEKVDTTTDAANAEAIRLGLATAPAVTPVVVEKPVPAMATGGGSAAEVVAKPEIVKPVEIAKPVPVLAQADTIVHNFAPTDTLHVYLSKNGDSYSTHLLNGGTQERIKLDGINKAKLNGTEYAINYLQAPAQSMQDMGVLAKLITGQPAGVANLQASAAIGNTSDLINSYISSDIISSTIATLSAHDLAATLVKNALGSTDESTIQWVEDFLKTHTLAELVELAVKNEAVIDHAFGSEGLQLI